MASEVTFRYYLITRPLKIGDDLLFNSRQDWNFNTYALKHNHHLSGGFCLVVGRKLNQTFCQVKPTRTLFCYMQLIRPNRVPTNWMQPATKLLCFSAFACIFPYFSSLSPNNLAAFQCTS